MSRRNAAAGKHWTKDQLKSFVKNFRKGVEGGWGWLTPRVQSALVSEYVLGIIRLQDRAEVPIEAIDELLGHMLKEILPDEGPQ